jgi:pSer/pThr/pTyr-binding forkhead associated (FHA) protein
LIEARLVIENGAGAGNIHVLGEGRTVIGRGNSCDVSIPTPNLSRQHALIERLEDAFWLVDMGSTNGVRVRGRSVQRHELQSGDVFELGDVRIRFEQG